jgi:serine O-acetyltransferase
MKWLTAYREDIRQFTALSGKNAIHQMLTQQGLWALMQYRMASAVYRSSLPEVLKRFFLMFLIVWQKLIEVITGIHLPCNCQLSQGVTIGVSGRGEQRGSPIIGDRVYFGANATVAGKIRIGNDAVIGANSLVVCDVPEASTVFGVPAQIIVQQEDESTPSKNGQLR